MPLQKSGVIIGMSAEEEDFFKKIALANERKLLVHDLRIDHFCYPEWKTGTVSVASVEQQLDHFLQLNAHVQVSKTILHTHTHTQKTFQIQHFQDT